MDSRKTTLISAGAAILVAVAIAVPASAVTSDSGGVSRADEPAGDPGQVEPAPPPLLSPQARAHFDEAIQCMADHGFGVPTGDGNEHGYFITPEEADSDRFRAAAEECELPPPPTDAQIRKLGCSELPARHHGARFFRR